MRALREFGAALTAWPLWTAIAKDDVQGRYKRTALGPFWLVLSQAGFIIGIYLLHRTGLGGGNENFLYFLSASLPVWGLITSLLMDGSNSMIWSKPYLESFPLPPALFAIRVVASSVVTFAHLIVTFIVVSIWQMAPPTPALVAFIPALIIIIVFGLGCSLGLGSLGARFRDIPVFTTSLIGLLFVLTPVFWVPTPEQAASPLVRFNPFFYLLEVGRAPLLGDMPSLGIWVVAVLIALFTLAAGLFIHVRTRASLIYWL